MAITAPFNQVVPHLITFVPKAKKSHRLSMVLCKPNLKQTTVTWIFFVGSMEALSNAFLLFFLLPDWLKSNYLKSRMECGISVIFSRHICSTVAETIDVTNYAASFGAKKCSENHIWSCWDDARSVEPTILGYVRVSNQVHWLSSILKPTCEFKLYNL